MHAFTNHGILVLIMAILPMHGELLLCMGVAVTAISALVVRQRRRPRNMVIIPVFPVLVPAFPTGTPMLTPMRRLIPVPAVENPGALW